MADQTEGGIKLPGGPIKAADLGLEAMVRECHDGLRQKAARLVALATVADATGTTVAAPWKLRGDPASGVAFYRVELPAPWRLVQENAPVDRGRVEMLKADLAAAKRESDRLREEVAKLKKENEKLWANQLSGSQPTDETTLRKVAMELCEVIRDDAQSLLRIDFARAWLNLEMVLRTGKEL
jgi:hypothetical protein